MCFRLRDAFAQFEFEGEMFWTTFYSRNYYLALPGPEYFPVKLSPEAI